MLKKPQARLGQTIAAALIAAALMPAAHAEETGTIVGKDDWLYFRWERFDASLMPEVDRFTDMLARAGRVMAANDVHVVFTVTPLKLQIYPQYLPADFGAAPGTENRNQRMVQALRAAGMTVADQLPAFQAEAAKGGEPLFLRLDSHWTPTGAMLAGQTIRKAIDADPKASGVLASIPEAQFEASPNGAREPSLTTDLLPTLPAGATPPPAETVLRYTVQALDAGSVDALTGESGVPQVTVIGSSFTHPGTQYPDAVRVALQRQLLDISIPGRQGPFVGMENYTRDPAFQLHPPKLLIWEVPERDSVNPPDSPWRDAEYFRDSKEWLLNLATAVSRNCATSPVAVQLSEANLPDAQTRLADGGVGYGPSNADSYVQLDFAQALDTTDYLWADVAIQGGGTVRLEATGSSGKTATWSIGVPEDGTPVPLKTRLPADAKGARSLRIFPGAGENFAVAQPAVCRHEASLIAGLPEGAKR
jgi:alginate O-acetyltransferase complex protein AlgJ